MYIINHYIEKRVSESMPINDVIKVTLKLRLIGKARKITSGQTTITVTMECGGIGGGAVRQYH